MWYNFMALLFFSPPSKLMTVELHTDVYNVSKNSEREREKRETILHSLNYIVKFSKF